MAFRAEFGHPFLDFKGLPVSWSGIHEEAYVQFMAPKILFKAFFSCGKLSYLESRQAFIAVSPHRHKIILRISSTRFTGGSLNLTPNRFNRP